MSYKKITDAYQVLRCYREAVKRIRLKGKEPSQVTLKRMADIKLKIKKYSNGQITE
jgi:hypothetical protein|tara:strand:- start:3237 stop:3404 length:168 start_codon:yes stop_codon:yes gene_type:complete